MLMSSPVSIRPPKYLTHAREMAAYFVSLPFVWARQFMHNNHGILRVLDITRFRPLKPGLIGPDHPWATGINPATSKPIWHENVLFRTSRPPVTEEMPDDDTILTKVGEFLAQLTALSTVVPEIPWGPRRRMPHGINYIHGTSHYNSGTLIFTDFAEAISCFSDRRFAAEIRRFARVEKREVLVIFRQREYSPTDYAYLSGFFRSIFPYFCNANGPQKRVLWGNASPYPVSNIITGAWIRDVYMLKQPGCASKVARAPIDVGKYFQNGPYEGWRSEPLWPEKLLARYTNMRVRMRGSKGGLFFVDRRKLIAEKLQRMKELGIADEPVARI